LTGGLVWQSARGPGCPEHAQQGLVAGGAWLAAALVAWFALKRAQPVDAESARTP
jgi:hypothetical protein